MSATFTAAGIGSWSPLLIIGDTLSRKARAVVHNLIGSDEPDVSFLPTIARAGTLELLVADRVSAQLGLALLSSARPIYLVDTDRPDRNMRLVVTGDITQVTEPETQRLIIVTVPVQEIPV